MADSTEKPARQRVLMVCGSLRERSFNRQMGEVAAHTLNRHVEVRWLDYSDVPIFNQDLEFPTPDPVARVRREVEEADALWILCPEYNSGLPAVLKNLIDWLSRPIEHGGKETALKHKLVTHSGAVGGSAAAFAAAELVDVLARAQADTLLTLHTQAKLAPEDYLTNVLSMSPSETETLKTQAHVLLERMGAMK
ncbi:MAG: NADPH-dependent FMN reductase [Bifidobacterium sp.]|nr:NADPH-dependent FMN reductase [Bifidobacterium sp.]